MDENGKSVNQTCERLGIKPADRLLLVRISAQTLQFFRRGELGSIRESNQASVSGKGDSAKTTEAEAGQRPVPPRATQAQPPSPASLAERSRWADGIPGYSLVRALPVSTSAKPPSNVKDSLGTPRGLHEIAERIGGEQPLGMVFKGRRPTGKHFLEHEDNGNLVTSRILWLRGLEPGFNAGQNAAGQVVDTYARYVYLHGTNREDLIGRPQSAGCVLLSNRDMVALYDEVRVGDQVLIID